MTLSTQAGPTFSDEELTAYLDGEADHALVQRIETALETSQPLRDRLQSLTVPLAQIRNLWDDALQNAPSMPPLPAPTPRGITALPFGAGLAAGIVIALAVQWGTAPSTTPAKWSKWQRYAAAYQALYVTETLASVDPSPTETKSQLQALGALFELDFTPVDAVTGADFRRGQVLGFQDKPLVQISFLTDDGTPLAFCILKRPSKPDAPMRVGAIEGLAAAEWSRGEYGFLLVGGQDQDVIKALAAQLSETI